MPIFLEITCDMSYPIAEGITSAFLGLIVNLSASIFLLIDENTDTMDEETNEVGPEALEDMNIVFKIDMK